MLGFGLGNRVFITLMFWEFVDPTACSCWSRCAHMGVTDPALSCLLWASVSIQGNGNNGEILLSLTSVLPHGSGLQCACHKPRLSLRAGDEVHVLKE